MDRIRAKERERRARIKEWLNEAEAPVPSFTSLLTSLPFSTTPLLLLARESSSKQRPALPGQVGSLVRAAHPRPITPIHTYIGAAPSPEWLSFLDSLLAQYRPKYLLVEHPDRLLRSKHWCIWTKTLEPPSKEQVESLLEILNRYNTTALTVHEDAPVHDARSRRGKDRRLRDLGIRALYKHGYGKRQIARETSIPFITVHRILGSF